jgi:uncharacterized protein (DUF4415 family)
MVKTLSRKKPKMVRYTAEELKKKVSKTDFAKLDALKDEDIDYSDIPELTDDVWEKMQLIDPGKKAISIRVDQDVLAWFKNQGGRYQRLINQILRHYMHMQQMRKKRLK